MSYRRDATKILCCFFAAGSWLEQYYHVTEPLGAEFRTDPVYGTRYGRQDARMTTNHSSSPPSVHQPNCLGGQRTSLIQHCCSETRVRERLGKLCGRQRVGMTMINHSSAFCASSSECHGRQTTFSVQHCCSETRVRERPGKRNGRQHVDMTTITRPRPVCLLYIKLRLSEKKQEHFL